MDKQVLVAGLDAALENGIVCGSWCPEGREAEDSVIPDNYPINVLPEINFRVLTGPIGYKYQS